MDLIERERVRQNSGIAELLMSRCLDVSQLATVTTQRRRRWPVVCGARRLVDGHYAHIDAGASKCQSRLMTFHYKRENGFPHVQSHMACRTFRTEFTNKKMTIKKETITTIAKCTQTY